MINSDSKNDNFLKAAEQIATELFTESKLDIEVLRPYVSTFHNYINGINAHMVEEMNGIEADLLASSYRTFESAERAMLEKMNVIAQNTKDKFVALLPSINHNETFKKYIESNLITFEEYKKLPDEYELKDFLAYNKQHFQSFDAYLNKTSKKALEEASNEASKEASKEVLNKSNTHALDWVMYSLISGLTNVMNTSGFTPVFV